MKRWHPLLVTTTIIVCTAALLSLDTDSFLVKNGELILLKSRAGASMRTASDDVGSPALVVANITQRLMSQCVTVALESSNQSMQVPRQTCCLAAASNSTTDHYACFPHLVRYFAQPRAPVSPRPLTSLWWHRPKQVPRWCTRFSLCTHTCEAR